MVTLKSDAESHAGNGIPEAMRDALTEKSSLSPLSSEDGLLTDMLGERDEEWAGSEGTEMEALREEVVRLRLELARVGEMTAQWATAENEELPGYSQ